MSETGLLFLIIPINFPLLISGDVLGMDWSTLLGHRRAMGRQRAEKDQHISFFCQPGGREEVVSQARGCAPGDFLAHDFPEPLCAYFLLCVFVHRL